MTRTAVQKQNRAQRKTHRLSKAHEMKEYKHTLNTEFIGTQSIDAESIDVSHWEMCNK